MARQHGVVLTYVEHLDQLQDCVRRGGYDTVKIVTGWGVDSKGGGWSPANMQRVLQMTPHIIIRTVAGDPSAGGGGINDFPDPDVVEREIRPWYAIRPDIMIEIGNEPNARWNSDDKFIWKWRYFIDAAIERCRKVFPLATLMVGGLMYGKNQPERFLEILQEPMAKCDCIAIHAYEFYAFAPGAPAYTRQLQEALTLCERFFPGRDIYLTEYGINDRTITSNAERGQRYASLLHTEQYLPTTVRGATYYHLALQGDADMQAYQIYPQGDEGYKALFASIGAPTFSPPLRKITPPKQITFTTLQPDAPLLGPASGSIERAVSYIKTHLKAGSEYTNDVEIIMAYYWKYAPLAGLDPFIAACQCIFETDALNAYWAARPRRNPAGLGVSENQGLSFASWELGVQAHLAQLLALAITDREATQAQHDLFTRNPRHAMLDASLRGAAKTVMTLGAAWSPNKEYGRNLLARINEVLASNQ
jgi:hypothetical protein